MQTDINTTAKSIASIFFAAKIYKALNKHVAKKESYIIDEYISLEDYLFENYTFSNVGYENLDNLVVIDYTDNILNLSGSHFITEAELVKFTEGTKAVARVDFDVDINNTKQITKIVAGVPQIIEITGQVSSKDITIREGSTPDEVEVYDSKTGNLIARIKLVITEKIKPLIHAIFEKIKKIFANDVVRRPLAYIIGLISGLVIMPIYNKIKGLFKSKQENAIYFEAIDDDNSSRQDNVADSEKAELSKTNKIVDKIIMLLSGVFKRVNKVLKLFVQFIVALLNGSKMLVTNLLLSIIQTFYALRGLFIIFLSIVAGIFVGSAKLIGKGVEKLGEQTNIQALTNFAQNLQKASEIALDKLGTIIIKEGGIKSAISQLKTIFYKAKIYVEQSIKAFSDVAYNPTEENKAKLVKVLRGLINKGIIEPIEKSVFLVTNAAVLVKNKSIEESFQQLCDVINKYITYLTAVKSSSKFINEFLQYENLRATLNYTIDTQIGTIDSFILELKRYTNEINSYNSAITQLTKVKENLIKLRVS